MVQVLSKYTPILYTYCAKTIHILDKYCAHTIRILYGQVPNDWNQELVTKFLTPSTWYEILVTEYLVPSDWSGAPDTT